MTPAMLPTRGGRREGLGLAGPSGERFTGRPSPPRPPPGRPHQGHGAAPRPRPKAHAGGKCADDERGGRVGDRGPPPRGRAGGPRRDPPPPAPLPARTPRGRRPPPPEAEGMVPPRPGETAAPKSGAGARPAPPAPAACSCRNRGEQANPHQRARAPHGPGPETASKHEPEQYRPDALHDENDTSDTRFVACPRKGRGTERGRATPRPNGPPGRTNGGGGAQAAPPPHPLPHPPARERPGRADTPHRGHATPSQVGGKRERAAPPQACQTEQGTGAGHAEGHGPRGTAPPAPSAGTAPGARATPPGGGGSGSGRRGSATAHTHKGHAGNTRKATGPSSRNAQTAWNGVPAREGKGHPDGTARHTQRGTRGVGRGKRGTHNTRYRPGPPNRPRAPRTHGRGTAPAKAVVAHCATPEPLG